MKVTELKTVDLLEVLEGLQEIECKSLGIEYSREPLPDGSEPIFDRLWEIIRQDQYGNQQFCNDSFYRVTFEEDHEDIDPDLITLRDYCREAMNSDEGGLEFILFFVCW